MTPAELKQRRIGMGLSQQALADLLGVRQATVSDWERGAKAMPHMLRLALWAIDNGGVDYA